MPQPLTTASKRSGLVTFAAVMLFVLGGFYAAVAFMEFFNATWLLFAPYNGGGGWLWLWGILDAIYALIMWDAAYSILAGGRAGRIIGIVVASLSAVRWLFLSAHRAGHCCADHLCPGRACGILRPGTGLPAS